MWHALQAEIITLRAIALKRDEPALTKILKKAEIITLRAIALKQIRNTTNRFGPRGRDHNATSYSTETGQLIRNPNTLGGAEIITLRAIALKHALAADFLSRAKQRS